MHPWLRLVSNESTIPQHKSEWFHLHAKLLRQHRALRKQNAKTKSQVFMLCLMLINVMDNLLEAYEVSEQEFPVTISEYPDFDALFSALDKTKERYIFTVLERDKIACLWQLRQLYLFLARQCDAGLPKSTLCKDSERTAEHLMQQEQREREARLLSLFARLETTAPR